jgi:hypothetical protein
MVGRLFVSLQPGQADRQPGVREGIVGVFEQMLLEFPDGRLVTVLFRKEHAAKHMRGVVHFSLR